MLLYHGTSEKYLKDILEKGILPRSQTNNTNWKHTIQSNKSLVYLTTCYAGYFAACASKKDEAWVIIEIDSDKLIQTKFRPDEDFIGQALHKNGEKLDSLNKITKNIRDNIDSWSHMWKVSLENLGTCSYRGAIPLSAITRISKFDPDSNKEMMINCLDPTISIMNYRFCSHKYIALTNWLMGDKITIEQLERFPFDSNPELVLFKNKNKIQEMIDNQNIVRVK